jgi:hypothetical protein
MSLLDNPIANMPGPLFLLFYGALLVTLMYFLYRYKEGLDRSLDLRPHPISPLKRIPIRLPTFEEERTKFFD